MTPEQIISEPRNTLALLARAALPSIPMVNSLPGVAKTSSTLPSTTLVLPAQPLDGDHVSAYAKVCGFATSTTVPLTYPHMLAFPLHLQLITSQEFPYPAIGTVHLRNSITRHRRIALDEQLRVAVRVDNLQPHAKGGTFDFLTHVYSQEELVWESTSTYLRRGVAVETTQPVAEPEPLDVIPSSGITWQLPSRLGRQYASVSGDYNPIHLYPLSAKALGFKRHIAHGMWSKARCVAIIQNRLPAATTVAVEFKRPIFLPSKVAFGSQRLAEDTGIAFSLTSPRTGAPHLVGRSYHH